MKRKPLVIVAIFLLVSVFTSACITAEGVAQANGDYVYLGGYPIGISAMDDGLIVIEVTGVQTENGEVFPLANTDIEKGDVIEKINGVDLDGVYLLKKMLSSTDGEVEITVKHRCGIEKEYMVMPATSVSKERKLGIVVKEDVSGIGTMTFVTLNGRFGALGHHILDGESGLCDSLDTGKIYNTEVTGVVRGEKGKAGGLLASLNRVSTPIGEIMSNTDIGIYGKCAEKGDGELLRVAKRGEATMGKAKIYTTIDGNSPKFYDIEIVKIFDQETPREKGIVIVVRDDELIEKTGGIVQGMSGSPIVQNDLLVGAVTHVFVGDSTRGYGVHARFMYTYATRNDYSEMKKAA